MSATNTTIKIGLFFAADIRRLFRIKKLIRLIIDMVHFKRQDMLAAEAILKILIKDIVSKVNRGPSTYLRFI
jgi:hypothetical protein